MGIKKQKWTSIKSSGLYDSTAAKKIAKVRITVFIDHDILARLKEMALVKGIGYQTILNKKLRQSLRLKRSKN